MRGKTVIALTLVIGLCNVVGASESHYDTYTYYTTVTQLACFLRSNRNCGGWWWGRSCWDTYWSDCRTVFNTILQIGKKCQTGWTSVNCDVPICTKPCLDGKVCTAPDTCQCTTTSGGCQSVPCDAAINCYPGSCTSSPNCACPGGFSGSNCINIDKTPDISACAIQLYSATTNAVFKTIACKSPGIEPQSTAWIGKDSISQIQVTWTTNYVQPFSLPSSAFAPHLANAPVPIGVAETGLTVFIGGGAASGVYTDYPVANGPLNTVNAIVTKPFSDYGFTPTHNQTMKLTVQSKNGGHKDGSNNPSIPGSSFSPQQFIGAPVTRSALLQFDLLPPVHCLTSNPTTNCPVFAIYLEDDITTVATVQPKFYNWTDQGSGIVNFHVEVYYMQPSVNNLLVNTQPAVDTKDVDPAQNNYAFTCTKSGVYSVELTVLDQAGNPAKARKLFIYNKDSRLQTDPASPVYVQEADPNTGYRWITEFADPRNGGYIPFTLTWAGHFSSSAQFDSSWGLAAQPWGAGIDDRYQDTYGRRSIYAITNMPGGIGAYGVAFIVDQTGGGKGLTPLNWAWMNATKTSYVLPIAAGLTDGSCVVVWLQCYDVAGASQTTRLVVGVDRTPADVKDASFSVNGIDDTTSSVAINTTDRASGISQISFGIYDSKLKNKIQSGSVVPKKRPPPPPPQSKRKKRLVQPCTANDATCYCIPSGDCFDFIQVVEIDNCWLDRLAGHEFEFRFTVTNGANMTSVEQTVKMGELSLNCRRLVPVAGIVVGVILGVLLLIALIVIVVLVVRTYVYKVPPPSLLGAVRRTVRNRFSRPRLDENVLYGTSTDVHPPNNHRVQEGTYVYNNRTVPNSQNIISNRDLYQGETICDGRFAIIRKGRLTRGNDSIEVATKSPKRKNNESDASLMREKIAFFNQLPSNDYVVEYLGSTEHTGAEGPVIVLEYCEMSLKDWLSKVRKVDSDALEEMMNFISNIASGVKFLHENDVIHRRLGARNVLLKKNPNGYLVAKIIGFGPNYEDRDGQKTTVPVKWMSPETLETFHNNSPTYNTKTDAWSFGITAWEIFSKGKEPFPTCSSDEVKDLLMNEKRMTLTCPEDCPNELYASVVQPCWNFRPDQRPEFSDICSNINSFRNGNEKTPGYYTMLRVNESNNRPANYRLGPLYDDAA